MNDVYSRHRPLALLACVVIAQVLLLAYQIKGEHDVRLLRHWAVTLLTPAERVGTWTFSKVGGIWSGYFGLRHTHADNERLQSELDRLRLRNRELESQATEAQRLAAMLNFREAHEEASMLAAQVIGASADPSSHTLFINRGERDHVRRNLPVITPDGVVGKIVEVFPATSQVLLINDKDSGVGALFADTRTHGVVKGIGDPDPRMDYVVNDEKVQAGESILTSGDDQIFPKGLLIGTVTNATSGTPFQVIHVKPATRLDRLEDVIVLLSQQQLAPKKTDEISDVGIQPPPAPVAATPPKAAANAPKNAASAAKPAAASPRGQAPPQPQSNDPQPIGAAPQE